ncbi:class I glutamine amidotransferase-like superfamily protein [Actinidia rufa]|uniref:Class I glutamine amidotransferase-like superfamily protein n=1 Tax=Actinidia rufa TaxID=165716 RepID=A0A7J0DG72_9ERIC|nr:class I glutamine amidotransferase-like superfamily protein [Actinidia rufa]
MPKMLSVIECHQDEVWELPPKVEVVAWSNKAGIEMFRYGDHIMGIQGHPEYTKDILLHLVDRLLHRDLITEPYADEGLFNYRIDSIAIDSYLANLPDRTPIPNQPAAERGDGALSSHFYAVRPKKEPSNLFYEGYHYLGLRKPDQPQMRLVTGNPNKDLFLASLSGFRALRNSELGMTAFEFNDRFKHRSEKCKEAIRAANKQKSRDVDVDALLLYEPHNRHKIPRRIAEFSGHASLDPVNSEEEEEVINQLVLNKRWGRAVFVVELEDPALPISILSSDNEHSDDLARAQSLSVGEVEDVGPSSIRADTMRFRNLKKKITPTANPAIIPRSLEALLLDKRKGTELSRGMPKRSQRGTRETSSGVDSDLWRPEFSACELSRQVLVIETSKSDDDLGLYGKAKQSAELKRAKKKMSNLESELKKAKILPGFDKEEYVNRLDEDENVPGPILARDIALTDEATNPAEEAGEKITEVSGERFVKETVRDDGEDSSWDPPLEI